ncbi:MAG: copper chaperone PCu(A)C [Mangrovicoccus sp.]
MRLTCLTAILALIAAPVFAESHADHGHEHDHEDHAEAHHDDDHDDHGDEHSAELGGIHALHAWARATEEKIGFVFVEIENEGDAEVILTGAETEIAESVELVGFTLQNGTGVYQPIPAMPIAAGTHLELEPEGLAFRLTGLSTHLEQGEEFEIEFEFSTGHMEMHVQIEAANASQHSHAGHQH